VWHGGRSGGGRPVRYPLRPASDRRGPDAAFAQAWLLPGEGSVVGAALATLAAGGDEARVLCPAAGLGCRGGRATPAAFARHSTEQVRLQGPVVRPPGIRLDFACKAQKELLHSLAHLMNALRRVVWRVGWGKWAGCERERRPGPMRGCDARRG